MTITGAPSTYSSVHGDLIYTVYDAHAADSVTYPNYKYIADIYINGVQVARIRKQQDPSSGIGVFNIGQVIRNYIATAFNPSYPALVAQSLTQGELFLSVVVSFGEEYNYVSYYDSITDTARKFYNHYDGRLIGISNILTSKLTKFATNNSLVGSVLLTSTHYLVPFLPPDLTGVVFPDPFTGEDASIIDVVITPYGGGSAFTTSFSVAQWNDMKILNIAPTVLNSLHAGTITASTRYYTVEIVGGQTYTVNLVCEPRYESYMIHFLNQYGGFESKLFSKVSRRKFKVDKKDFGKLNYIVDSSGVVSYKNSNGVYNEGLSVYSTQFEEKLTLNSDLLTDAEYTWLKDLIISPMVYIQDGSYFFPVRIEENDYEPKKAINDDLTNLTITVAYGQNLNGQFR